MAAVRWKEKAATTDGLSLPRRVVMRGSAKSKNPGLLRPGFCFYWEPGGVLLSHGGRGFQELLPFERPELCEGLGIHFVKVDCGISIAR